MKPNDIVGQTYVNNSGDRYNVVGICDDTVKMKRNGKLVTVSWESLKEDIMNGIIKPS